MEMEISIRECQVNDYKSIYELNKNSLGYDYPIELTKDNLSKILMDKRNRIFVAIDNDAIVGYVHAIDYDAIYSPHMKNIMGIAVEQNHRRIGIGKLLLEEIENWARETGASSIRLVSGSVRTGAHAFYRDYGFINIKEQINFKFVL